MWGSLRSPKYLVDLFRKVWQEGCVPQEWKDALIVPIPKKGDLSLCDNWKGISLLDIGGTLFAKIIQQRLLLVAERVMLRVLPDTVWFLQWQRFCRYDLLRQAVSYVIH